MSKPLYEESLLVRYRRQQLGDMPPHVYAIAEEAYQKLAEAELGSSRSQSILVSGESGAGKVPIMSLSLCECMYLYIYIYI